MQVLLPSARSCKASPLHEFSKIISREAVPDHRVSLEKDVNFIHLMSVKSIPLSHLFTKKRKKLPMQLVDLAAT